MPISSYEVFGLNMSKQQLAKVLKAADKGASVTIRLKKNNLHGNQLLPLTKTQVNRIKKSIERNTGLDLTFSVAQLKHCKKLGEKSGGFLPLLTLLPLLFGGLGAAGAVAGGTAGIVNSVKNARAQNAAQVETERHNRAIEEQNAAALKSGTGILSNVASKIPVFGETIKYYLEKLGLGIDECKKIKKGECVCIGKGLYLGTNGNGLFLGPKYGSGLFLGPTPR